MNKKIKLFGNKFILVGNKKNAAIATKYQYENFKESTAHLFEDGIIRRYGVPIGILEDIEFLDDE